VGDGQKVSAFYRGERGWIDQQAIRRYFWLGVAIERDTLVLPQE
jgi:hypothetical protein